MNAYRPGDHVYPTDLPRRFLCRVDAVDHASDDFELVRLEPLEGPWPPGTQLLRLADSLRPAPQRARRCAVDRRRSAERRKPRP